MTWLCMCSCRSPCFSNIKSILLIAWPFPRVTCTTERHMKSSYSCWHQHWRPAGRRQWSTSLFIEQSAWHAVAAFWQQSQPLRGLGFEQSSPGWQRTCNLMGIEHDSGHRYRVKIQQVRITLASRRNGGKEKGRLGSRSLSWWLYSPLAPSCFYITPSCISGQVAAEFHRCHFGSPSFEET